MLNIGQDRRFAPGVFQGLDFESVRFRHPGDAVAIDAVPDHEYRPVLAEAGGDRHFQRGGSGTGGQHRIEIAGDSEGPHEFGADALHQVRELLFPVAEVRLQLGLAYGVRHVDRSRIEQYRSFHNPFRR